MFYNLNHFQTKNIEYICKLDIKNLQKACADYVREHFSENTYICKGIIYVGTNTFIDYNPTESKVRLNFINEIYNFLFRQDLHIFLGINKDYFKCLMHKDNNNEASLFQKDNGIWIYKCFNKDCKFKIGDINKITECLTGLNRPDALDFLMQVYGVVLEKNEWQIKQERIIDANIELLLDIENIKTNYPELYKRIKFYIPQLIILHEFAKRNITLEQAINSNLVTFTAPVRQISDALVKQGFSGDLKQVSKRNNILAFIGLLLKLSDDMVLPSQLQRLRNYALSQGYNNYQNLYAIPSYNYDVLSNAENKAIEFKETGMTVKGFSKEMLINGFTTEEVKKVYPRQENQHSNGLHEKIADMIKSRICEIIKKQGFCFEKDIYDNGYFVKKIKNTLHIYDSKIINKKVIETVYKIYLPDIINSYNFKRCRLTNELKKKYNINIKGNPNILIRSDDL